MSKTDTLIQSSSKARMAIRHHFSTRTRYYTVILLFLQFFVSDFIYAQQPDCALVCVGKLNVSLDANCEATITADMALKNFWDPQCKPNGPQAFMVFVMYNGDVIPTSPKITADYLGKTLQIKVKHWKTGNTCWTDAFIEDKMPPVLKCPPNVTIACNAPSDPSHTGQATATDCTGYTITHSDITQNFNCNNPAGKITRTWFATDLNGFSSSCTQIITIKKTGINDVVFPKNLDGIQSPALDCSTASTDPSVTGYPTIDGYPINNSSCMVSGTYSDQKIDICTGTYKILRTWTLVDWCTGQIKTHIQIIKVEDKTGPVITCPNSINGNSYSNQCIGSAVIPAATITDNCSGYSVQVYGSWGGSISGNGGTFNNIPIGNHTVSYIATDDCGNSSSCTSTLKLIDNSPPVVICHDKIIVSIGGNGVSVVNASSFDDGSYDNCCLEKYEVKKMGEPDINFGPSVSFNCDDAGKTINIILKVTDCSGNESTCMTEAEIQDKLPPSIICPPDATVSCPVDISDLSKYGSATAANNCGNISITETSNIDLSSCGTGKITRTFTATASNGKIATCTQTIYVNSSTPFTAADITWPKDYDAQGCTSIADLDPDDLPAGYDKTIINNKSCSFAGVTHTDEVFDIAAPACFKILRKWVVIDWCQYDPNKPNSPGRWEHTQIIKVFDTEKPVLDCPDDVTVSSTTTDCSGAQVTLPPLTATDCNPKFTVTNSFNNGGANASGFYPLGTTLVTFTVTDGCKNTSTCVVKVTVTDGKKPTPICLNGLSITIMPSTLSVTIWAKDFISKVLDDCTPQSKIIYKIAKSPSGNQGPPADSSITFTCDDLGKQAVDIWVGDEAGNWDYCTTFIDVQDNMNSCPPGSIKNIIMAGKVKTESGKTVENVELSINTSAPKYATTDNKGEFLFPGLKGGNDYTISPTKDINPMNGISTIDLLTIQKHILGHEPLGSPYKLIAADIDKNNNVSTKDLLELRKLILQLIDKFPSNTSWRFIDGNYVFPDPSNPFKTSFPEVLNYPNVKNDMLDLKIVGIKVGDVDGTAKPNEATGGAEVRSEQPELKLSIQDKKLVAGEVVEVPVYLNQTGLEALQFTLSINPDKLEYIDLKSSDLTDWTEECVNAQYADKGHIAVAWASVQAFNRIETPIFTLRFRVKSDAILSQNLQITDKITDPLAYTIRKEVLRPGIIYEEANLAPTLVSYHNAPNPFRNSTNVYFYLSYNTDVLFKIYDINGKMLLQKRQDGVPGMNSILVDSAELPHSGLYIYEITTPVQRVTDKMILTE